MTKNKKYWGIVISNLKATNAPTIVAGHFWGGIGGISYTSDRLTIFASKKSAEAKAKELSNATFIAYNYEAKAFLKDIGNTK